MAHRGGLPPSFVVLDTDNDEGALRLRPLELMRKGFVMEPRGFKRKLVVFAGSIIELVSTENTRRGGVPCGPCTTL